MAHVSASVSSGDDGTDWLTLPPRQDNIWMVRIRGTFVATVSIQCKRAEEDDTEATPIITYNEPIADRGEMPGPWLIRAFVDAGDYTSGTIQLDLYNDF